MSASQQGNDDAGEPELPQLLPDDSLVRTQPRHVHLMSAQPSQVGTSSDLPTFSSDDITPSADNYSSKRRKHRRVGPWWQVPQRQDHPRKKRRMERNFDSGIFMGSENSFASSDIPSSELDRLSTHGLDEAEDRALDKCHSVFPEQHNTDLEDTASILPESQPRSGRAKNEKDTDRDEKSLGQGVGMWTRYNARRKQNLEDVEMALEHWRNGIDLKGKLTWLIDEPDGSTMARLFQPLHHLVHTRTFDDPERYEHLIPDIRLYLDNNFLPFIPLEVYRLENLTHLSVRNNQLQKIDPCIRNCTRLKHLDLWNNQIQWLPAELLLLADLKEIYVDDSHFVKPLAPNPQGGKRDCTGSDAEANYTWCKTRAMSQISYLDSRGIPMKGSAPRPSEGSSHNPSSRPFLPLEPAPPSVRNLVELCVTAAAKYVPQRQRKEVTESFPHLVKLLDAGYRSEDSGCKSICLCGRVFVEPKAEWLEWQSYGANDLMPFLWRACSWYCAQERRKQNMREHAGSTEATREMRFEGFGWSTAPLLHPDERRLHADEKAFKISKSRLHG